MDFEQNACSASPAEMLSQRSSSCMALLPVVCNKLHSKLVKLPCEVGRTAQAHRQQISLSQAHSILSNCRTAFKCDCFHSFPGSHRVHPPKISIMMSNEQYSNVPTYCQLPPSRCVDTLYTETATFMQHDASKLIRPMLSILLTYCRHLANTA